MMTVDAGSTSRTEASLPSQVYSEIPRTRADERSGAEGYYASERQLVSEIKGPSG